MKEILSTKQSNFILKEPTLPNIQLSESFKKHLTETYNESQLSAINTATNQYGFTLIQGPPGTGKTSTIIGMLNSNHLREYDCYYKLVLDTILGPEGQLCRASTNEIPWVNLISKFSKIKPRILVVAPSNVAVDNIIERILENGFLDGNCCKYKPNILRIGGRKTARVKIVSLDDILVQEQLVFDDTIHKTQDLLKKKKEIEHLNIQISNLIRDIYFAQSLLINLKIAFESHVLPEGL
jgi:hypothetical protein